MEPSVGQKITCCRIDDCNKLKIGDKYIINDLMVFRDGRIIVEISSLSREPIGIYPWNLFLTVDELRIFNIDSILK